jgi:AcrR family transcriptional regulator
MPDKRQAIMQTAERLFSDRRIHEITLDEVAQVAQVGKGTIYRYFRDKDDLFFQVATSGFEEMCGLLRENVPVDAPFTEQLLQTCLAISAFFQKRREMFRMMQAEDARMPHCKGGLRARWLKHREKLVTAVADILGRGVEDGIVRNDIPAQVLAHMLLGLLRARALDFQEIPEEWRRYEVLIDVFCTGVATNSTGGRAAHQSAESRKLSRRSCA